jgi:ankyrin repeat protein
VAASQRHLKVVNLLLERNSEVDHQDRDGTTPAPLWAAAASMGTSGVCELLLFWRAYVDHIDGEGRTVLSVAAAQVGFVFVVWCWCFMHYCIVIYGRQSIS